MQHDDELISELIRQAPARTRVDESRVGRGAGAQPAVSVVIPTYQRRELVERAVRSVLSQTRRDFELIVVDDGSTDGTEQALALLACGLRYHWQPNRGVSAARNTGIGMARGTIIAFLDSDDRWLPDHLAVVTRALQRHPTAVLASTCGFGESTPEADIRLVDHRAGLIHEAFRTGAPAGVAVRAEALSAVGGFDERMAVMEDNDLWLRLATVGPFSMIARRTIVCQSTTGSLGDRGRRAGHYLTAAELSAHNLISALMGLPEPQRERMLAQARWLAHIAGATRALDQRRVALVRSELEQASRLPPLSNLPLHMRRRVERHLPRAHHPAERRWAYATLAEVWPDPDDETARHLRALADLVEA